MGGKSKSKQDHRSTSTATSTPLGPAEVGAYFDELNTRTQSGANPSGRLFQFARNGTPATAYAAPTDAQLAALGGQGATRRLDVERALEDEMARIAADPSLTTSQAQRSRQLANREASGSLDAIDKEVEALITQLAFERAAKQYEAGTSNASRTRDDLALLAEIFFGGKGQSTRSESTSSGKTRTSQFNLDNPFSFNFGFG
ncbi:MAG: hypothetical protein RLW61_14455 [Gammaproteobacteria bacterium]